jgi:hypothetical protein
MLTDIFDFNDSSDLLYIFTGILIFDIFVLFIARFYPNVMGSNLNIWYDRFGVNAVLCDVLSIFLGFVVARWIFTKYFSDSSNRMLVFAMVLLGVQIVHDLIFYFGIVKPIPRGHNAMIDMFKDYGSQGGAKIIGGDAILMLGSLYIAMILKNYGSAHILEIVALSFYTMIYVIYTRWQK